jgi:hypothetical protein
MAQAPAPADPPDPRPVPAKVILEYTGTPIKIPFDCGEEEIQAFGMSCTEDDPCPVYSALSEVQPMGQRIFIIGSFHNGSASMYSLLLSSSDGGKKWEESFERIRFASLENVEFFDLSSGWISGHLMQSFPRDPFLLTTRDGGATWTRRPILGDPAIAVVEHFAFSSRTAGTLVLDRIQGGPSSPRYERYESNDGGSSWNIKEAGQSLAKFTGTKDTGKDNGYRLRADTATKAHILETRSGARWRTVAAFLLEAGKCQPNASNLEAPEDAPVSAPPKPLAPPTLRPAPRIR